MTSSKNVLAFIIIFFISFATVSIAQNESVDFGSIPKNWPEIIEEYNLDRVISDEDKATPIWNSSSITSSEEKKKEETPKANNNSPCNQTQEIGINTQHCAPGWGI